jgi:solute carrier family 15 (oligopeptide transporter), member 1
MVTVIGLVPMVIGSGSIRVNLSIFGATQYKLPEQAAQLSVYFTFQYFVLKCGSVMGRLLSPILRQDVKCFGMNDCYPLAFGFTAAAMTSGFLVLILGSSIYVKLPTSGNMMVKVCRCIIVSFAIVTISPT